jgi:hypothetical protein
MEDPTAAVDASIPTESVTNPNQHRTVTVRRKAAKRSESWYHDLESPPPQPPPLLRIPRSGVRSLASLPPPQDEDMPPTKKPRLETPFIATARMTPIAAAIAEAAKKARASPNAAWARWALPPPADFDDDDDDDDVNAYSDTTSGATGRWTPEEDAELTSAVVNSYQKKRYGNECKRDWVEIAALVSGRTNYQCSQRWQQFLDPSIDAQSNTTHPRGTKGPAPRWTREEDAALTNAVSNTCKKKYGEEFRTEWADVVALVPGRTIKQCLTRWHVTVKPSIARPPGRAEAWTREEDFKLRQSVQMHGRKEERRDWVVISAQVPSRTKYQCQNRWHDFLKHRIERATDRAIGGTGTWTEEEDAKLKDSVHLHGGRNWDAITALVTGRTKSQCQNRWYKTLNTYIAPVNHSITPVNHSVDLDADRSGKWTEDEDSRLKVAFRVTGGKEWSAIATLVPGRTKRQCHGRWHDVLQRSTDRATGGAGTWTEEEDAKLKASVHMHGGKNWIAITALVPGRTKTQCQDRWYYITLNNPSIAPVNPNVAPVNRSIAPMNHSIAPVNPNIAPMNHSIAPVNRSIAPVNHSIAPVNSSIALVNRSIAPVNHIITPVYHSIALDAGRAGKWSKDEDEKLKNAVHMHGGNHWTSTAALVPGRAKAQCISRWHDTLKYTVDHKAGRAGTWTEDEDDELRNAVKRFGCKH